jgi:nitrogen regulatory protein PII
MRARCSVDSVDCRQQGASTKLILGMVRQDTCDSTIKMAFQCVVHDDEANCAVRAILCAARTGCVGDGDVVVVPIEHRFNIHNGDRDAS